MNPKNQFPFRNIFSTQNKMQNKFVQIVSQTRSIDEINGPMLLIIKKTFHYPNCLIEKILCLKLVQLKTLYGYHIVVNISDNIYISENPY